MSIMKFFLPRDRKFFPLFEKAAANLRDGAKELNNLVTTTDEAARKAAHKRIEDVEHQGDDITHEIFNELSSNFITPFDREDIHELVTAIDDILDFIHGASKRMELYKITEFTADIIKLSELVLSCTEEILKAVSELRNLKNPRKISDACVRINSMENHADDIFDSAVARLFEEEKDAIKLIKMKEVLAALETATDKCEDAANVIESVLVKNS